MELSHEKLVKITSQLIYWIKKMIVKTGGNKAVIGISGGKDSSIVAALCVEALGKENVFGVLMPNGIQKDISYAHEICEHLMIKKIIAPIKSMVELYHHILSAIDKEIINEISNQTKLNLPPRVRMTLLYAIAQSIDSSRVINTSNLSEDWVGYATINGDTAGAFAPIGLFTTDEVIQIGRYLKIPEKFIIKPPEDGLTGKTDEDVLGFSYNTLNKYIRDGKIDDPVAKNKIDKLHRESRFKFSPIAMFNADLPINLN
ncbi:NAD(+) synthase [Desulfopila inferna]|uniref:NAD(+) synthase n=1 Tax=Desulfopila inferna TaxID=468528 RepID=UPI0019657B06|nr:NAD(+) synthase [Desulfopila inferna]MBM9602888.1 NAD(+) synthase [Desulfopila inferna]